MAEDTTDQQRIAEEALRLKAEGEQHHSETGDHADEGMTSIPFADQAPSGALDAEGHRPVLERSRKVR